MNGIKSLICSFTIQFRMLGAIVMVVAMLLIVGGTGLLGMQHIKTLGHQGIDKSLTVGDHLSSMYSAFGDVRRYEKDLIINREDAAKVADYDKKWLAAVSSVRAGVKSAAADTT